MKIKCKVFSFLLMCAILTTTFAGMFPPLEVWAADGASISSLSISPSKVYDGDSIQVKGTAKRSGSNYLRAIQINVRNEGDDNHGFTVDRIDFDFSEKKTSYSLSYLDELEIDSYECTGCGKTEYFDVGKHRIDINIGIYDSNGNNASNGITKSIWFEVLEEESIDISDDYFEFDAEGGEEEVCVYASSSYTLSESLTWITLSSTSGSSDKWFTITCKENTSPQDREGTITVTHKATGEELEIEVYQEAAEAEVGFDFSDFWCSDEIELGEDLEWEGFVELDNDYWEIVNISISIKHPDGSAIYYRATDIWDWYYKTEKIQGGSIPTDTIAPKGYHPNNSGGYYEINDFIIDEPGTYELYVSVYAEYGDSSDYESKKYEFEVLPAPIIEPEVLSVKTSVSTVTVGQLFTITVVTNSSAEGVAIFGEESGWELGRVYQTSSTNTYVFTYKYQKTNAEDSYGNDITNIRTIIVYPIVDDVIYYDSFENCHITVEPAENEFPDFTVYSATGKLNETITIKWEAVKTHNGTPVIYSLWINGKGVSDNITTNSYTLTAKQVEELGVGNYGVMVMATAVNYRQRQADGVLTVTPPPVPVLLGDVNGDGKVTDLDVTRLREYLANCDDERAVSSLAEGADVNKDGKINGKDLTKLMQMLVAGGSVIPPEPKPVPPVIQHTYTVKFPLDKADLKATSGKTIYIMPLYGYFELVAYDENGNKVSLSKAGISIEFSKPALFKWGGNTVTAKGCGFSYITLKQNVNGKLTETQYAVHVGEYKSPVEQWAASYRYSPEDYEYVSMCLDLMYSITQVRSPGELDVLPDWTVLDYTSEYFNSLDDYIKYLISLNWDFETEMVKEAVSAFFVEFGDQIAPEDETLSKTKSVSIAVNAIVTFICENYDSSSVVRDFLKENLGNDGYQIFIENIKKLKVKDTAKDAFIALQSTWGTLFKSHKQITDFISKIPELRRTIGNIDVKMIKDSFASIAQAAKNGFINRICDSIDGFTVVGMFLEVTEAMIFVVNDYTYSIIALTKLRDVAVMYYDPDDPFVDAISELIQEYEKKWLTAVSDAWNNLVVFGISNAFLSNPVLAIAKFAAAIMGEVCSVEERKNIELMNGMASLIYKGMDAYSIMYTNGKYVSTSDDLKLFTSMYLSNIRYQLKLALEVNAIKNNANSKNKVENHLKWIETAFKDYLSYRLP